MKLLYTTIMLLAFNLSYSANDDNLFEGIITYQIEYTDVDERLPLEYLYSTRGDSMSTYMNENGYIKKYFFEQQVIQRRWFERETNSISIQNQSDDTLYYYLANDSKIKIKIEKTDVYENIIGYKCQKFIVTSYPSDSEDNLILKYDYYITTELNIDPKVYENFIDGGLSKMLSEVPGVILKEVYYGSFFTSTHKAIKLEKTKVNIKTHLPKRDLIMKKLF